MFGRKKDNGGNSTPAPLPYPAPTPGSTIPDQRPAWLQEAEDGPKKR